MDSYSVAKRRPGAKYVSSLGHNNPTKHFPIIVHSHLGWDWVWQRPQQFHSRLSRRHRVLFVEGPRPVATLRQPTMSIRQVADCPGLTVLRMEMPADRWGDGVWVD